MFSVLQNRKKRFLQLLLLTFFSFVCFSSYSKDMGSIVEAKKTNIAEGFSSITDKAGEQTAHPDFSLSENITGYLVYLPNDYYENQQKDYPIVIFLHGAGERGTNLSMVRRVGPPKMVDQGKDFPFILISPQSKSSWSIGAIDLLIDKVIKDYRVDENRLYVTGLSMGGAGTWSYTCNYPDRVAAAVPICGWGPVQIAYKMKNVPVWATHNKGDNVVGVDGTINMVNALENAKANPMPIEIIYPVSGHDAWTRTYNDDKMWEWMLSKSKNGTSPNPPSNKAPVANAGSDKIIRLPENNLTLSGSGSDSDGQISTYIWTKSSGPTVTMTEENKANLKINNLLEGTYIFKLTVTDNKGSKNTDEVKITVLPSDEQPTSSKNGLYFTYYEGRFNNLPDFSKLNKVTSGYVSNFDLSPRKRNDNFAFTFEGKIQISTSGEYIFYTNSDDGSKLYIDNQEVVNNDGVHADQEKSGKITLSEGMHSIKVAFFEQGFGEVLGVKYAGPGISKRPIPTSKLFKPGLSTVPPPTSSDNGLFYTYYEGKFEKLPNFSTLNKVASGNVSNFDLSPRKRNDNFAFTFEGKIQISTSGEYIFYTNSDDGSKLYIDNQEVVNNDGVHADQEKSGKITLSEGMHDIKVAFFEQGFGEVLGVKYAGPGISKQPIPDSKLFKPEIPSLPNNSSDNGLFYAYYEGSFNKLPDFSTLNKVASGSVSNFDLSPRKRNDNYAFTFEGKIEISTSGEYIFYTNSDDGSKLYIDNQEVVNNDGVHADQEKSGKITLSAGMHNIKVAFFEQKFGATLGVKYAGPGIQKQPIPNSKLFKSSTDETTSQNTIAESSILINFNDQYSQSQKAPWNNVASKPHKGLKLSNLKDDLGKSTSVSLTFLSEWGGSGTNSTSTSTIVPEDVSKTYFWTVNPDKEIIKIDGLENSKTYSFTFYGYKNTSGNKTTKYTINSKTVSLNAANNSSNTARIINVVPNSAGEVLIYIQKDASAGFGYINSLIIESTESTSINRYTSEKTIAKANIQSNEIESEFLAGYNKVYPNPFKDFINIELFSENEGASKIRIFDLSGNEVKSLNYQLLRGLNKIKINTSDLGTNKGLFILTIELPQGQVIKHKLLKD